MIRLSLSKVTAMAAVVAVREYGRTLPGGPEFLAVRELVLSLAYGIQPTDDRVIFHLGEEDAQRFICAVRHAVFVAIDGGEPITDTHPLVILNAMLPIECREVEPADSYDPDVCPAP